MPATAPSFSTQYDKTLDELEEKRLAHQKAVSEAVGEKPDAPSPTRNLFLEYVGPDGTEHRATLVVRIATHDEILRAGVYASQLAGANISLLPVYMQNLALGRAFIAVMWGKSLPEWLKKVVETDEEVVFSIFEQIEEHRRSFFRRDVGEGVEGKKKPGLRISQSRPTPTATK